MQVEGGQEAALARLLEGGPTPGRRPFPLVYRAGEEGGVGNGVAGQGRPQGIGFGAGGLGQPAGGVQPRADVGQPMSARPDAIGDQGAGLVVEPPF